MSKKTIATMVASGELLVPATFYFEGKPFEQNAHGIYVPAGQIESAVINNPTFTVSIPGAFNNLSIESILNNPIAKAAMDAASKKVADNIAGIMSKMWTPISDLSIHPMCSDKNAIPIFETGSLKFTGAVPYGPQEIYGYPIEYGPSPLQYLFKAIWSQSHSPFTIEHDDSHLFTRPATKSHAEAFDEQEVLRGMYGTHTGYAWSEVLGAHVPIC